jgi:anthranilate synthase component 2
MQAIGECFGAKLLNLPTVYHGVATRIHILQPEPIFNGCPPTFNAGRYHSWVIDDDDLPPDLVVTSRDGEQRIMSVRHKRFDVRGVQFHPESILSEHGELMIKNWLDLNIPTLQA